MNHPEIPERPYSASHRTQNPFTTPQPKQTQQQQRILQQQQQQKVPQHAQNSQQRPETISIQQSHQFSSSQTPQNLHQHPQQPPPQQPQPQQPQPQQPGPQQPMSSQPDYRNLPPRYILGNNKTTSQPNIQDLQNSLRDFGISQNGGEQYQSRNIGIPEYTSGKIRFSNQFESGGHLGAHLRHDSCLETVAREAGIRFFLMAYSPLNTDSRTIMIPSSAICRAQKGGCRLCLSMYFNVSAVDADVALIPDPCTLIQLPWEPAMAWVMGDMMVEGKAHDQCPRNALRRVIEKTAEMGYMMKAGVEPEFTLMDREGLHLSDPIDLRQTRSHNEPMALLRNQSLLNKIHDVMEKLGWGPYQLDHEAASCQFEVNYQYSECMLDADRFSFLKFMIKSLAESEGLRVTFMPVPTNNLICSNGLHINMSVWDSSGDVNLFIDPSDPKLGISQLCRHFIGGILDHVVESCAIFCPIVNSYKRLNKACWCPNTKTWGGNNRTVLVRVPCEERVEFRMSDGSCNPYLSHAFLLAAGMDGVAKRIDPGQPMVTEVVHTEHPRVPRSLTEALNHLEGSSWAREWMGGDIVDSFVALKRKEYLDYEAHLSDWERGFYINC